MGNDRVHLMTCFGEGGLGYVEMQACVDRVPDSMVIDAARELGMVGREELDKAVELTRMEWRKELDAVREQLKAIKALSTPPPVEGFDRVRS